MLGAMLKHRKHQIGLRHVSMHVCKIVPYAQAINPYRCCSKRRMDIGNRTKKGVSKTRTLTVIVSKVAIVVEAVVEAVVGGCAARAGSAVWVVEAIVTKVAKIVALRELAAARRAAGRGGGCCRCCCSHIMPILACTAKAAALGYHCTLAFQQACSILGLTICACLDSF